jgi:hypothetical protein
MSGIITLNANASFGLPTESEWYKAAYHHPASQGGPGGNYWMHPTRSNVQPNSRPGGSVTGLPARH